jgi:DNA-binding transcriptional LysR family regulator
MLYCDNTFLDLRKIGMNTLQNLRAFLAVVETGSFSAAARRSSLATSVLTKRVDQLEHAVRTKLFTRTTRTVTLTEAGQRWIERVRFLLSDIDDAMRQVSAAAQELEGPVRIKAPTTLTALYIGDVLTRFQSINPKVSIELVLTDRVVNPADEGFDLAIAAFNATFSGVVDVPLCPLRRQLCAAPEYLARRGTPRHPRELLEHETISFAPTGDIWSFSGPGGPSTVELAPKFSANDGQVLLKAARAGNGIALLSEYLILPSLKAGELVTVLEDHSPPEIWVKILIPEARVKVARVHTLSAFVKDAFSPSPPWARP